MRPEFVKDVKWFAKRPFANRRIRQPSKGERVKHSDVSLVIVTKGRDGGFTTEFVFADSATT
jgi:hypothetical protein